MPNFKVTATMDVGYTAIIEAENEDEAWAIARGDRTSDPDWEQTDNGHDWTLENIWEVDDDEVSQAANDYDVNTAMDYINFSTGRYHRKRDGSHRRENTKLGIRVSPT